MKKENLIHYRTSVCNINYHVVWSVKYRRKVLDADVEQFMRSIAVQAAEEKGFSVQLFECGDQDHVHCFLTAPPKLSVTVMVKILKGITARKAFQAFPSLKEKLWKGELWNHSYYCETIGSISEENIRRYIQDQEKAY